MENHPDAYKNANSWIILWDVESIDEDEGTMVVVEKSTGRKFVVKIPNESHAKLIRRPPIYSYLCYE